MIAISLQSGSNGNCIFVETGDVKLVFDAGISASAAEKRLSAFGRSLYDADALIISHDHGDHIRHLGTFSRRFGMPVLITPATLQSARKKLKLGKLRDIAYFNSGDEITFGNLSVQTIPAPHDGSDGVVFMISTTGKKLGIFTDLGYASHELYNVMPSLDGVFIESNYDPAMLFGGPYPEYLKQRIAGPEGHLSNREAAELIAAGSSLKWACLAHLSENNNTPSTALKTHLSIIGHSIPLHVASRYEATGILTI
jgi:phosphoribosyl 1,2-cyclic phosphodiesterase